MAAEWSSDVTWSGFGFVIGPSSVAQDSRSSPETLDEDEAPGTYKYVPSSTRDLLFRRTHHHAMVIAALPTCTTVVFRFDKLQVREVRGVVG